MNSTRTIDPQLCSTFYRAVGFKDLDAITLDPYILKNRFKVNKLIVEEKIDRQIMEKALPTAAFAGNLVFLKRFFSLYRKDKSNLYFTEETTYRIMVSAIKSQYVEVFDFLHFALRNDIEKMTTVFLAKLVEAMTELGATNKKLSEELLRRFALEKARLTALECAEEKIPKKPSKISYFRFTSEHLNKSNMREQNSPDILHWRYIPAPIVLESGIVLHNRLVCEDVKVAPLIIQLHFNEEKPEPKNTKNPKRFTFSEKDIYESWSKPSTSLHVTHWSLFPTPRVCILKKAELQEKLRNQGLP